MPQKRILSAGDVITAETIEQHCSVLGVEPGELIPCHPGTKEAKYRGYAKRGYQMNWPSRLKARGGMYANLAVLYGKMSRLIGIDCDTPLAEDLVQKLVGETTYIRSYRGSTALLRTDCEVGELTAASCIDLKIAGENSGELRLQKAYSIVGGWHKKGCYYDIDHTYGIITVNLHELISALKSSGIEIGSLRPAADARVTGARTPGHKVPAPRQSDISGAGAPATSAQSQNSRASFWCREASRLASIAPARSNGTGGTNSFVLAMTTALREEPQLCNLVVSVFTEGLASRKLTIRDGSKRLEVELKSRLAGWRRVYGRRSRHTPLIAFFPQSEASQSPYVLVRFFEDYRIRRDFLPVVLAVAVAFRQRATVIGNQWCYESVRSLSEQISPKAFSRVLRKLVETGFLQEDGNDVGATRAKHLTAQKKYRCSDAAMRLTWDAKGPKEQQTV